MKNKKNIDCKWVIMDEYENCTYMFDKQLVELWFRDRKNDIRGDYTLWIKKEKEDPQGLLRRLLLQKKIRHIFLSVAWKDEFAALCYSDLSGSEYWVTQSNFTPITTVVPREIRLAISFGELNPLPYEYYLRKSDAFSLIYESIKQEKRLSGINYIQVG